MKTLAFAALAVLAAGPANAAPNTETAVLAGGCFWGMESVFEHVKGITNVVSGYAGGSGKDANYPAVSSEHTAHAEAVKISYDPRQISYKRLLDIFFTVAHDPTQIDRQSPDVGRSYRSAIFPQSVEQERLARSFIARATSAHVFRAPIATRIEHGSFYVAEAYHQGFARRHPFYPYIFVNDQPKVQALARRFPALYRA